MNFENETFEEQPQAVEPLQEDNGCDSSKETAMSQVESMPEESEAERGVPVGKFKNVDDLYQAYNNLQAEFTRKSQRLAELEKDKIAQTQQFEKTEEEFKQFLADNQEAFSYATEIKKRVAENTSLKNAERPFEKAWAEILTEKLRQENKMSFFENLINNDENLKNLIIENYIKQLQSQQKSPVVISSGSGERATKVAPVKPDSFEEAKKIDFDLFS